MADTQRIITNEDFLRRYNLQDLKKNTKVIKTLDQQLTNIYGIIKDYINTMVNYQSTVQYYLSGVPTLENLPASEWETPSEYLNAIYYDIDGGKAYIFKYDNDYYWEELNDSSLLNILSIANSQNDTANDNMRRIFYAQPTVPYSPGDIWVNGSNIYRCKRGELEDGQYYFDDWVEYTQYDETMASSNAIRQLNQFKETVETDYVTKTLLEATEDEINASVTRVENVAKSKNKVFTSEPTTPYYRGDSYIKEVTDQQTGITMNLIYVCQNTRETGNYHPEDFSLQPGYATAAQLKITSDSVDIVVSEIGDRTSSQTTIAEDINSINARLSEIELISDEEENDGYLTMNDLAETSVISLRIYPKGDYDLKNRYAADHTVGGSYKLSLPVIDFYNGSKTYQYELPRLYFYDGVYDEFILDNVLRKAFVIHRIGFTEQQEKYILSEEVTEELDIDTLKWFIPKGNNTIFIPGYVGNGRLAHIKVKAMLNNEFTSTFATEAQLDRSIEISEKGIISNVSNTYATKTELGNAETQLNSNITQAVNDSAATINASVTRKLRDVADQDGNVTGASLVLAVNEEGSSVAIDADKININGVVSANGNFEVDTNGDMTCNNATINGDLVTANGVLTNLVFPAELWGWYSDNGYDGDQAGFLGFNTNSDWTGYVKSFINFSIRIPPNFKVESAKLYLRHTPVIWDNISNHKGNCRNIKVYKLTNLGQTGQAIYGSEYMINGNATWGSPITNDDLTFSSSTFEEKSTSDFKNIFSVSSSPQTYNVGIRTTMSTPQSIDMSNLYSQAGQYTGIMTGYAEIIGYLKK